MPLAVLPGLSLLVAPLTGCGDDDELTPSCQALRNDLTPCIDSWCDGDGSGSLICDCWEQGGDVELASCRCVPYDWEATCQAFEANGEYVAGTLDCTAYTDILAGTEITCP